MLQDFSKELRSSEKEAFDERQEKLSKARKKISDDSAVFRTIPALKQNLGPAEIIFLFMKEQYRRHTASDLGQKIVKRID